MTYTYRCVYAPFGCTFTRTRKGPMEKHVCNCPYAEKFKVYIDAIAENITLKEKVRVLEMKKGRPPVVLHKVDFDHFTDMLLKEPRHIRAVLNLAKHYPRNLLDALVTYFIYTSKRFFKTLSTSEVDLKIRMGAIRTFDHVETHTMQEFCEELYESFSYFLEDEHQHFHIPSTKNMKLFQDVTPKQCLFVFNTMRKSVHQRNKGGPIEMHDHRIPMPVIQNKPAENKDAKLNVKVL